MGVNDDYWKKEPIKPVIIVDGNGNPVTPGGGGGGAPQNVTLVDSNNDPIDASNPLPSTTVGFAFAEGKTQADAVENVITFSQPITAIEIYHDTPVEAGDWPIFEVNGLAMPIAPGGYRTEVAGTPSVEVTIPADTNCIVNRLV